MPFLEARDIKFFYTQSGEGPDVLLVHGITGNMAVWMLSGLIQKLAKQFRVTAFDMRGHGYSETPPSNYTSADMSDDIAAICSALNIENVRLLGHSFGAVVTLHAAYRHNDLVQGVILSDPFVPALRHLQSDPRKWKGFEAYKKNAATVGMIIDGDLWDLREMLSQAASLEGERREAFVEKAGEASLERLVRLHETTCGSDVAEIAGLTVNCISSVQQDVVCLYGEHSPFLPMCQEIGRIIPQCVMDMIPDAQHFAFEENPTEFIDRVERHFCTMANLKPTEPAKPIDGPRRNVMTDSEDL